MMLKLFIFPFDKKLSQREKYYRYSVPTENFHIRCGIAQETFD